MIGIIGYKGRLGSSVVQAIQKSDNKTLGPCFSRSESATLEEVFQKNDCVIDVSHASFTSSVLTQALSMPKPLILCLTNWQSESNMALVQKLAEKAPVVIAPNTSTGSYFHRMLVQSMTDLCGKEWDIDLVESHHRAKADSPSGSAKSLIEIIQKTKQKRENANYQVWYPQEGLRPENAIGVAVQRSGIHRVPQHSVHFSDENESIVIQHTVFNKEIFASGVLKIIDWLQTTQPEANWYTMEDVLQWSI